jgi:type IV pilus assembly protein PilX
MRKESTGKQQGMVLITVLLILVVMTLLGISSMQSSNLEERMAHNTHDNNMAFQSAESGLRDAAGWIGLLSVYPKPDGTGTNGIYSKGNIGTAPADYTFDWDNLGTDYGTNTPSSSSDFPHNNKVPEYVIEEAGFVSDDLSAESTAKKIGDYYYQISAIGYGGTDTSEAVTQSTFEKRFN